MEEDLAGEEAISAFDLDSGGSAGDAEHGVVIMAAVDGSGRGGGHDEWRAPARRVGPAGRCGGVEGTGIGGATIASDGDGSHHKVRLHC